VGGCLGRMPEVSRRGIIETVELIREERDGEVLLLLVRPSIPFGSRTVYTSCNTDAGTDLRVRPGSASGASIQQGCAGEPGSWKAAIVARARHASRCRATSHLSSRKQPAHERRSKHDANPTFTYKSSVGGWFDSVDTAGVRTCPQTLSVWPFTGTSVGDVSGVDESLIVRLSGPTPPIRGQDRSTFLLDSCSLQTRPLAAINAPSPARLAVSHQRPS
jgi:hypothetical protein